MKFKEIKAFIGKTSNSFFGNNLHISFEKNKDKQEKTGNGNLKIHYHERDPLILHFKIKY